jgi:hypothetical protein
MARYVSGWRHGCWIALISVLLLPRPSVAEAIRDDAMLQEQSKVRLREVRLRVRPHPLAHPKACLEFGLDDLKVSVRGQPIERARLLDLERGRRQTLHAVLIDASRSAAGKLDYFRSAASEYLAALRPELESGLVASFDESVILLQPPTRSRDRLVAAVADVRMGAATALNDGLYFIMRELEGRRERPVILLITDGFDTASMHSRAEVHALAQSRPELTIFTIGVGVPPITAGGPPGLAWTKRFLQRLAARTNGRYFDVATGSRLARAFARIRQMLDDEAILTFIDPNPEAESGPVKVASRNPDCKIDTFRVGRASEPDARRRPLRPPFADPPQTLPLPAADAYRKHYRSTGKKALDPDCGPWTTPAAADDEGEEALWFLDAETTRLRGCMLDITMESGMLYAADSVSRILMNAWLKQKTRPLEIPVPSLRDLPTRIEQVMPALAEFALAVADDPVETDPRQVPIEQHARPYHDYTQLNHGKLFFEVRSTLARALFTYPEYRAWVRDRLRDDARAELNALKERFRRYAPHRKDAVLDEVVRLSREGSAVLRRSEQPSEVDLQGYLAAWLGDISAHDLFVRWETDEISALVRGDPDASAFHSFRDRWREVRRVFFVPSYARILTLLTPVFDPEQGRIGYWRVVLPRPSWALRRVKGYRKRTDYADLPLDLVPDLPLAYWAVDRARTEHPEIFEQLRGEGSHTVAVRYALRGKAYRHDAKRGFRETRVEIDFRPADGSEAETGFRLTAELSMADGQPRSEGTSWTRLASRSENQAHWRP